MKLVEVQKIFHPQQVVSILYRDPTHSLATSVVFKGAFKMISDNSLLQRNVAVCRTLCNVLYIEVY